jgi:hypothetical protein
MQSEEDPMNDDNRVPVTGCNPEAGERRWQQVLAFGCLPDGCWPIEDMAMRPAPSAAFDVIP